MRNIDASNPLGIFLSDQHFLVFFCPRPQSLRNEPKAERQPKATQPCPAAEKMAREMRVRWLQEAGMSSVLCWQGTCRGCASSPQTPLNVELPQKS